MTQEQIDVIDGAIDELRKLIELKNEGLMAEWNGFPEDEPDWHGFETCEELAAIVTEAEQ